VIVDNENVASQLLDKGRLQKAVTIIPLNKIQRSVAPDAVSVLRSRVQTVFF
jgi:structural maintenance of chromosome 2